MLTTLRPLSLLLAGLLLCSGCSLLVSKKRQLKRYVHNFNVALAAQEWKKAATFMSRDFEYTPYQGRSYGGNSPKAYLKHINDLKGTDLILTINEIEEISETKMLVTATRQVRNAGAASTTNRFWEITMLWQLSPDGKKWMLMEIKQISEMRRQRS